MARSEPARERHEQHRETMVARDLRGRDIRDRAVLEAMATVPREEFVGGLYRMVAYEDRALPIAAGQTISQPYIVALMTQACRLGPQDKVLEIGTGSGYAAAVLSLIAAEVWTVERHEQLVDEARRRLGELGYDNVHVVSGDGSLGWPEAAPYDAIVVTAAGPRLPTQLVDQLVDGGRLVMPVGHRATQELIRVTRSGSKVRKERLGGVRFVPLVGSEGWEVG